MYIKHNMYGTRFYRTWQNVKSRVAGHQAYYKKGMLTLSWKTFDDFKKDMYRSYLAHSKKYGERNTSIDRIDPTKGYSKENCRWATQLVQCNNRKNNIFYTYKGQRKTMNQWAVVFGIEKSTFRDRLRKYKWPFEKAIIPRC